MNADRWMQPKFATFMLALQEARRLALAHGECVLVVASIHNAALRFDTLLAASYAELRESRSNAHLGIVANCAPGRKPEMYPPLAGIEIVPLPDITEPRSDHV